jgi:outer membrane lipoprotein-sorting protein
MRLAIFGIVSFAVAATPVSAQGAPCGADSVIALFEKQVEQSHSIRLNYKKEASSALFGKRDPESGILWLGPPRRYRVENKTQVVVRGEDTLWSYSPATEQVIVRYGNLDSLEFGPAGFFGSLRTDFLVADCKEDTVDDRLAWKVRLAARTETAAIQRLTLWLDQLTLWVFAAEYVDYNEEAAHLTFTDYRIDHPDDRDRFKFVYPVGVERIALPIGVGRTQDSGR